MPTPAKGARLGGGPAHERHILANLAQSLFEHGRITTTEAKAKRLRPYAEHLITFGKRGDLHARRQVLKRLNDKSVVHTLFAEIGPRYADRPGGYTRILKMEPRKGDNARMALIELVDRGVTSGEEVIEESKAGRSRGLFGRRRKNVAEEAAPAAAGTALLDDDEDVEEEDDAFDVEDDAQVAAAIAEATGTAAEPSPTVEEAEGESGDDESAEEAAADDSADDSATEDTAAEDTAAEGDAADEDDSKA